MWYTFHDRPREAQRGMQCKGQKELGLVCGVGRRLQGPAAVTERQKYLLWEYQNKGYICPFCKEIEDKNIHRSIPTPDHPPLGATFDITVSLYQK